MVDMESIKNRGMDVMGESSSDDTDEKIISVRYLSLFSGIEAVTVAWKPLGWECVGFAEIEPFPCAVLKHHYPDIPNLGDITKITEKQIGELGRIDVVVWGSPCQDLSVAGKKRGLDGERSGLFRIGWNIVQMARKNNGCRFSVWENVPGVFSINRGRDFAEVVGTMAGLEHVDPPSHGFGTEGVALGPNGLVEWATLDAQWRGVAQRRRRVFALADFGNWQDRPPILLEPEGLRGDSPPSREERKRFAPDVALRIGSSGTGNLDSGKKFGEDSLIADVAWALQERDFKGPDSDTKQGHLIVESDEMERRDIHSSSECFPINTQVALRHKKLGEKTGLGIGAEGDPSYPLQEHHSHAIAIAFDCKSSGMSGKHFAVRRLTVVECCRLQGFPDDYLTQIPWKGKSHPPDGVMYRALGNSMTVPVMRYIGERMCNALRWERNNRIGKREESKSTIPS